MQIDLRIQIIEIKIHTSFNTNA